MKTILTFWNSKRGSWIAVKRFQSVLRGKALREQKDKFSCDSSHLSSLLIILICYGLYLEYNVPNRVRFMCSGLHCGPTQAVCEGTWARSCAASLIRWFSSPWGCFWGSSGVEEVSALEQIIFIFEFLVPIWIILGSSVNGMLRVFRVFCSIYTSINLELLIPDQWVCHSFCILLLIRNYMLHEEKE